MLVNSPQKKAGRNEVPGVKDADDLSVDSQVKAHEFIHEQALSLIHAQSKEQSDQEVLALRLLERLIKQVVGVHALEVISGKNKLSVLFQGCDFGELLQIASGGNMLPGSMQEEYEKAQSKKRNVSTAAASK